MSQIWIKLWSEKILSSLNLRQCNFTENSVYLQLLLRARTGEKFTGILCFPDGRPVPDDELANDMKLKLSLFKKAVKGLVARTVLIKTKHGLLIRKFKDLQKKKGDYEDKDELSGTPTKQDNNNHETSTKQDGNNSVTTASQLSAQTPETKGVSKNTNSHIEESNMKKNNKNALYQSIFDHWNKENTINHRKLTNKMKRIINGRLDDGFTEAEIKQAITNYVVILESEKYWWIYTWVAMTDFLNRGLDKFKDWNIAHTNYLQSDKKLASLKDKKEEQFETGLNKIITECKKCDGKGSTLKEDGTHECSCRKRVKELRAEHKRKETK